MLNLMRLEIKKFKLNKYIKGVIIANFVIIALLCLINLADGSEGNIAFPNYEIVFSAIDAMTRKTFIVFASVLLGKLIIEEYKTKTITLMFMYPINRKKIMISKLLIVGSFTFLTIFTSNIFIGSAFYVIDSFLHFVPTKLTSAIIIENVIKTSAGALAAAGISLIPLYFGMRKKSVPTTIVSAILIGIFLDTSIDDFSLYSIIAIPISLAVMGVFVAYLSIRNIESADAND